MQDCKSLVESRSFWSALLALVAVVASTFHLGDLAAWAADPRTIDSIVFGVAMLGALGAIVFRFRATARTTSVLPPGSGPGAGTTLALACALPALGAMAGCSTSQLASYSSAASATAGVLKQIGGDLVRFDCQYGDLIRVIASDAGAARRVQASLDRNAAIVRDACPAINGAAAVAVVAGR